MKPAVLFARRDSVYKTLDCDVWDEDRNALNWPGGAPVVAHPPCRGWGNLRHMSNHTPAELELAIWSIAQIRKFGGVLEHPNRSTLWQVCNLPQPGQFDEYGGFTLPIIQYDFGHRAEKKTLLYIVGCTPARIPKIPLMLGAATHVIGAHSRRKNGMRPQPGDGIWRPEVSRPEREATPHALAVWLLELAGRCAIAEKVAA